MATTLLDRKAELSELIGKLQALNGAELSDAVSKCETLEAEIVTLEKVDGLRNRIAAPGARIASPAKPVAPGQFANLGQFTAAVRNAAMGQFDPRLTNAQTEGTNSQGGYVVPPDIRTDVINRIFKDDDILGRCTQYPTASNLLEIPYSNQGITAAFTAEGAAIGASQVALGQLQIPVLKCAALVKVTDELVADAPAFSTFLTTEVARILKQTVGKYVLTGAYNATTTPKGILASVSANGAGLVIAKEAGQTALAGTLVPQNIDKLWAALLPEQRANAVWLVAPSLEPAMLGMVDGAGHRLFIPGDSAGWGNITGAPSGTMYGRPVVINQFLTAAGTQGDIVLVDLSGYFVAMRADAQFVTSLHFYFDTDFQAVRATIRVGGAPGWASALTLADTSVRSYMATLANH